MLHFAALIALATYVSAQSISEGCTNALATLAQQEDVAACLNPVALLPFISATNSTPLTPMIDNWLTGFCAGPACSNETIARVITEASEPCAVELAPLVNVAPLEQVIAVAQRHFLTARGIFCLKEGEDHCVTKTFEAVEETILQGEDLTLTSILGLILNPPRALLTPNNPVFCSSCMKSAWNIIVDARPDVGEIYGQYLEPLCSADFINGETPAGITQSANSETDDSTGDGGNGAATLSGAALTGVAVVSTVYALLA